MPETQQTQIPPTNPKIALQSVGRAIGVSISNMAKLQDAQLVNVLGTAAIIACLPQTAALAPDKVAATVAFMHGQKPGTEMPKENMAFVNLIQAIARELAKMDAAKTGAKR